MADSYVCSGAMMKCTMGTSPAKLTVLPARTVNLTGMPQANISDHKSMVNLAPFGLCRSMGFPQTAAATAAAQGTLTPMPCVHNTPAPWMGGKMDYLIKGQPALLKSCKCQCMWGGTISFVNDGQIGEGTQYINKKEKDNFVSSLTRFVELKLDEIPSKSSYQTDSLLSESASVNQIKNNQKYTVPTSKYDYFFGKVNSSKDNALRSKQNEKNLRELGITKKEQLDAIFDQAINTEGNIVENKIKEGHGTTIIRMVEIGKSGCINVSFFYENSDMESIPRVTTIIPKIYKKN